MLTYAFISAFKFPDMLNVHLRCTVEICRHGCPDHCTGASEGPAVKGNVVGQYSESEPVASGSIASPSFTQAVAPPPPSTEVKVNQPPPAVNNLAHHSLGPPPPPIRQHPPPRFPPHSGEMFNANVPPQMRPPPPLPQFGGRPQRAPRPQPHPQPNPHHFHSKFPPGLIRQRPEFHRFPPGMSFD